MPDIEIDVTTLSRDQLNWLNKIIAVIGEPASFEDSIPMVQAIEAARLWFLRKQKELRDEGRR